jgi:NADH dehydrogenase FAD-containing subunit
MQRKHVVVLGSGYAGSTAAAKLDRTVGIDVTLVSPNDGFVIHKIAALRAVTKGGNW